MRSHCIMHVPFEGPGFIEQWLDSRQESLTIWRLYESPDLPDADQVDFLVIMGGSMSIYDSDRYPWLKTEKSFIRSCIEGDVKIIGICLGAQLLADALGKDIYPGREKEIGWFPVKLEKTVHADVIFRSLPETITAFHWHGETYDIPDGALRIGGSEACINQGFIWNAQVLAIQFHLEVTPELVIGLIRNGKHELDDGLFVQNESEMIAGLSNLEMNRSYLFTMLDGFVGIP